MEKQIEKKQAVSKAAEVNVDSVVYVNLSDMQSKDILALPRYNGSLVKTKSRRGQIFYKVVIELDPLLKIERTLTETEFNLIVLERNLKFDVPIQHLIVPARLITGLTAKEKEWKRYELFVSKNLIVNEFFKDHEIALIKAANLKLQFVVSDKKYEDDLISSFNEDDFI